MRAVRLLAVAGGLRSTSLLLASIVAGGLVFTGQLTGEAAALDARNGRVVWRDQTNNAIGGGVITYAVGGKQYVAVAPGLHAANWPTSAQTNRFVAYALS